MKSQPFFIKIEENSIRWEFSWMYAHRNMFHIAIAEAAIERNGIRYITIWNVYGIAIQIKLRLLQYIKFEQISHDSCSQWLPATHVYYHTNIKGLLFNWHLLRTSSNRFSIYWNFRQAHTHTHSTTISIFHLAHSIFPLQFGIQNVYNWSNQQQHTMSAYGDVQKKCRAL